jgi:urea transporter
MEYMTEDPRQTACAPCSAHRKPAILLRGVGQIMLQPSAITGAFFLAGILMGSGPSPVAATICGAALGQLGGLLLRAREGWISDGLFGFNGALAGLAIAVRFDPSILSLLLICTGAIVATILMKVALEREFPAYTAPFVIASWITWSLGSTLGLSAPVPTTSWGHLSDLPFAPLAGIGQVMFQAEPCAGLLFLGGVLLCPISICSGITGLFSGLRAVTFTFGGSLLGQILAAACGAGTDTLMLGIYGYNGALTALAVSMFAKTPWWPFIFAWLSTIILCVFQFEGWPPFTAPFVIATWIALVSARRFPI